MVAHRHNAPATKPVAKAIEPMSFESWHDGTTKVNIYDGTGGHKVLIIKARQDPKQPKRWELHIGVSYSNQNRSISHLPGEKHKLPGEVDEAKLGEAIETFVKNQYEPKPLGWLRRILG
jgi:hypothetical protein